jgi:hypothetical protein
MRRPVALWCACLTALLCVAGCSNINKSIGGGGNTAPVSLTIHDAMPANISIVSLQLQIMSATLQPGNLALVPTPVTVDLAQLQTDTAFLGTANIAFGTYNSVTVTFANPVMTFVNNTGGPITPFGSQTACLAGAVCQFVPVVNNQGSTVVFTASPFPLSINSASPVGLELDMDFADLVQSDFSLNFFNTGAASVVELASVQSTAELRQIDHVLGTVTTLGANQFTLTTWNGQVLTINSVAGTAFSFPAAVCASNDFRCVAVGQVLDVTISLLGSGTLNAKEIDFEDAAGNSDVQGVVVNVGAGTPPTSFEMVAHQVAPSTAGIATGNDTDVTINSGATFVVDNHLFVLPAGLTFTSASNLLVGQEVLARVVGNVTAGPPSLFSTDRVLLRRAQITALVSAPPPAGGIGGFTIQPLPSFMEFALPTNILSVNCELTAQTQFEGLTPDSSAGILVGDNVSVSGFLFAPMTGALPFVPNLATDKVRGQPLPGQ